MEKENRLLSVIVPVYNVEPYLRRCLESICRQTYRKLEIICVNDGSTDQSLSILQEYAMKDSRIQVISKENGGLVSARKTGLLRASGKYATYVDSDDWIEQGMYENLMALMENESADIITSGDIRDYGTHTVTEPEYVNAGVYKEQSLLQLKENLIATDCFFRKNLSVHLYDKIFNKDYLLEYQLRINNQINVGEDAAVVYPAMLNAKKIIVSGKNYYHYCLRSDSIMGVNEHDDLESVKIMLNQVEADFNRASFFVTNTVQQYKMLQIYMNLLRNIDEVIKFKNNFLYPFGYIKQNARVVIYGAGKFGKELKTFLDKKNILQVIGLLDETPGLDRIHPSEIRNIQYDYVLIGVLIYDVIEDIKEKLRRYGVNDRQMLYVDAHLI